MAQYLLSQRICKAILNATENGPGAYTIFSRPANQNNVENPTHIPRRPGFVNPIVPEEFAAPIPPEEYTDCLYINFYNKRVANNFLSFGIRTPENFGMANYLRDKIASGDHFGAWGDENRNNSIIHGLNSYEGLDSQNNLLQVLGLDLGWFIKGGIKVLQTELNIIQKNDGVRITALNNLVDFALIHFNTEELQNLINISPNRQIYLTENLRSFANMEYNDERNEWNERTNFVTLTASVSPVMNVDSESMINAVFYTDGRPCPPYWHQPN